MIKVYLIRAVYITVFYPSSDFRGDKESKKKKKSKNKNKTNRGHDYAVPPSLKPFAPSLKCFIIPLILPILKKQMHITLLNLSKHKKENTTKGGGGEQIVK